MASRSGPRAPGTDGSDFTHREKIVSHYQVSADLKTSVRKCLLPHMLLTCLLAGKQLAASMGSTYFAPLMPWEMVWVVSGLSAYIGFGALAKNDISRLSVYLFGNLLFGIAPLVFGCVGVVKQMQADFQDMTNMPETWKASPMRLSLIAVCFSWQVTGIVQSIRLIKVWRSMGNKKNN